MFDTLWECFWPAIQGRQDAKKVAHQSALASFLIATVTSTVIILQSKGKLEMFPQVGTEAFIDVGIFAVCGLLVFILLSRIAALAAFGLYLFNQYLIFTQGGGFSQVSILSIVLVLWLYHGVRSTWSYHQFKKEEAKAEAAPPPKESLYRPAQPETQQVEQVEEKTGGAFIKIALLSVVIGGLVTAGYFFLLPQLQSEGGSSGLKEKMDKVTPKINMGAVVSGKTFELKSGETLRGTVMHEDADLIIIKTADGKEHVHTKDELL